MGVQTLFQHLGSNDPTTENWIDTDAVTGSLGVQAGPVTNDAGTGLDAWSFAYQNVANYRYYTANTITVGQLAQNAVNSGWVFTTDFRMVSYTPGTFVDFVVNLYKAGGGRFGPGFDSGYDLELYCDSQGVLHPTFGGVNDAVSPELPFPLQNPNDYHEFQIVFDPTSKTADLSVDGTTVLTNVAPGGSGGSSSISWGLDYFPFGARSPMGQVNVNLVRFDIVPEPASATMAAFAAAGMALAVARQRWPRRV